MLRAFGAVFSCGMLLIGVAGCLAMAIHAELLRAARGFRVKLARNDYSRSARCSALRNAIAMTVRTGLYPPFVGWSEASQT